MPDISVNRITNANVYLNGANMIGRCMEIELPEIEFKFEEHEGIGLVGSPEFFTGIDVIEATFSWTAFYRDAWLAISNPVRAQQIQVRANLETWNSAGLVEEQAAVVFLTGTFKKLPMGSFTKNEVAEFESDFSATSVKLMINREVVTDIDVLANVFKVGGVDILQNYRRNIGG